jgi:hypothetical protein
VALRRDGQPRRSSAPSPQQLQIGGPDPANSWGIRNRGVMHFTDTRAPVPFGGLAPGVLAPNAYGYLEVE